MAITTRNILMAKTTRFFLPKEQAPACWTPGVSFMNNYHCAFLWLKRCDFNRVVFSFLRGFFGSLPGPREGPNSKGRGRVPCFINCITHMPFGHHDATVQLVTSTQLYPSSDIHHVECHVFFSYNAHAPMTKTTRPFSQ
jgi:hypothetical protein